MRMHYMLIVLGYEILEIRGDGGAALAAAPPSPKEPSPTQMGDSLLGSFDRRIHMAFQQLDWRSWIGTHLSNTPFLIRPGADNHIFVFKRASPETVEHNQDVFQARPVLF
jgi:hypothetical protein